MPKETKTNSAWVSLELWDNSLDETLRRWNHNKWSLPKDHKANVEDIFFYGIMLKHEGNLEIFTFTDGYIFVRLKDKTKIPPPSKIHGAVDWVKAGSHESNTPVVYFDDHKLKSMKKFVQERLDLIMENLKEGSSVRVSQGLYKGMEGVIDKKEGVFVYLKFYLNSKNFETMVPFWFLETD